MEEKDLIRKIQLLKQVKPKEDWVIFCRSRLAFRLEMERKRGLLNKDLFALREVFAFWRVKQPGLAFKAAYALILVLGVILVSGALVALAAMNSAPGSPLYPVKLVIEKARVSASFSDEGRLQLRTEIADKRLQELKEVVNNQDSAEQKAQKLAQVMDSIKDQLTTINNQLPKAGAKTESKKAVAAAKIVSQKADQVGKALANAKEALPTDNPDLNTKIAETTQTADNSNIATLETMIANQDSPDVKKEEIAAKLDEAINKTGDQIKAKEQKIAQKDFFADKLSTIRAVLIYQFEQNLELLDKAREALNKGDLKGSLDMLKLAKNIDSGTDNMMTQNASNSSTKDQPQSATSSDAVNVAK